VKRWKKTQPVQILFSLGLGTAVSLMGDATLYAVLPTHTAQAGISLGAVGILLGVNRAVRVFLNGPVGLLYDRLPRRRLLVPALFLGALSTAIYAATRGFWPLLVGRALWGLAWSGIWVGGATVIMDVTTASNRGRWTGVYQMWFFAGAGLGAFAGGLLTDSVGYATTMWISAALTALAALPALFFLPETRGVREGDPAPCDETVRAATRLKGSLWVAVTLQGINRFAVAGVVSATLGLLVERRFPAAQLGLGVATLTGALIAGRTLFSMATPPLVGWLSDRIGDRWKVSAGGLALGAASMVLLTQASLLALLTGALVGAASSSSIQAMATTLTGDLARRGQRGRAIGLLHTSGDVGSALGPPAAYALLPLAGLQGVYLLCAVALAAGLVLALWSACRGRS